MRKEQKVMSSLVESLGTHIRALMEQQQQLRVQLEELDSRLRRGTSQLDPERNPPSSEAHRLKSLECRLAEMESSQAQLKNAIQSLQLLPRMPLSRSQPLPLKAPSVNGDTT